jgi:hypothetical protein
MGTSMGPLHVRGDRLAWCIRVYSHHQRDRDLGQTTRECKVPVLDGTAAPKYHQLEKKPAEKLDPTPKSHGQEIPPGSAKWFSQLNLRMSSPVRGHRYSVAFIQRAVIPPNTIPLLVGVIRDVSQMPKLLVTARRNGRGMDELQASAQRCNPCFAQDLCGRSTSPTPAQSIALPQMASPRLLEGVRRCAKRAHCPR